MSKLSRHFELSYSANGLVLEVTGIGYFHTNEEPGEELSYDIEEIMYEGKDVLPAIRAIHPEYWEQLERPILECLETVFEDRRVSRDEELQEAA